jgi:hypothetical protein
LIKIFRIIEITDTDIAEKADFEDLKKKSTPTYVQPPTKNFKWLTLKFLKDVIFSVKEIFIMKVRKRKKEQQYELYGSNFDSEDIEDTIILK